MQAHASTYPRHLGLRTQTVTKNAVVYAIPRAQRRLVTNVAEDDSDDLPGPDELDMHVFYRRPTVNKSIQFDADVSDYVAVRLATARAKAMEKYREKWLNSVDT